MHSRFAVKTATYYMGGKTMTSMLLETSKVLFALLPLKASWEKPWLISFPLVTRVLLRFGKKNKLKKKHILLQYLYWKILNEQNGLKNSSMTKKYIPHQSVNFAPYLSLPPWRAVSINNAWVLGMY